MPVGAGSIKRAAKSVENASEEKQEKKIVVASREHTEAADTKTARTMAVETVETTAGAGKTTAPETETTKTAETKTEKKPGTGKKAGTEPASGGKTATGNGPEKERNGMAQVSAKGEGLPDKGRRYGVGEPLPVHLL